MSDNPRSFGRAFSVVLRFIFCMLIFGPFSELILGIFTVSFIQCFLSCTPVHTLPTCLRKLYRAYPRDFHCFSYSNSEICFGHCSEVMRVCQPRISSKIVCPFRSFDSALSKLHSHLATFQNFGYWYFWHHQNKGYN